MKWGQKVDSPFASKPREEGRPPTVLQQARPIALGILIAAAVIFTVWRVQQPSDFECRTQALDVLSGTRLAVESACVGRF